MSPERLDAWSCWRPEHRGAAPRRPPGRVAVRAVIALLPRTHPTRCLSLWVGWSGRCPGLSVHATLRLSSSEVSGCQRLCDITRQHPGGGSGVLVDDTTTRSPMATQLSVGVYVSIMLSRHQVCLGPKDTFLPGPNARLPWRLPSRRRTHHGILRLQLSPPRSGMNLKYASIRDSPCANAPRHRASQPRLWYPRVCLPSSGR